MRPPARQLPRRARPDRRGRSPAPTGGPPPSAPRRVPPARSGACSPALASITDGTGSSRAKYDVVSRVGVASTPTRLRRPRARRHDDGVHMQSAQRDRLALVLDRLDPRALAQTAPRQLSPRRAAPAARDRRSTIPPSGWKSPVSPLRAGSGSAARSRPASSTSNGTPHAASASRFASPVAEVECSGLVEQRTPEPSLELLPERICLLREPNPAFLGIGEPDDSRAAVTRAVAVSDFELLADHDVVSRLSEGPCRCEAHHSGADDCDLGVGARLHDLSVPS